jgi:OOP family OmpA-OmpF porin
MGRLRNDRRTVTFVADDSSTKLAAQAIAGLAWSISGSGQHLDLTYRYLTVEHAEFASFITSAARGQPPEHGDRVRSKVDYDDSHTVTLGLRYAFGADELRPSASAASAVRPAAAPSGPGSAAAAAPRRSCSV